MISWKIQIMSAPAAATATAPELESRDDVTLKELLSKTSKEMEL